MKGIKDQCLPREPVVIDSNESSCESGFKARGENVSTEVPCFSLKPSSSLSPSPTIPKRHSLALWYPLSWVMPTKKRATGTSLSNLKDHYQLGKREGKG